MKKGELQEVVLLGHNELLNKQIDKEAEGVAKPALFTLRQALLFT